MTAKPRPASFDAAYVDAALDYPSLVARIGTAFLDPIDCPARLAMERGSPGAPATMLVMAAGRRGGPALVKTVTVGSEAGVRAHVVVTDAAGRLVATIDGEALTARRTAAASVRAAAVLARPGADRLAILGAGPQAAALAQAYLRCRLIRLLTVWARRRDRAEALADALRPIAAAEVRVAAEAGEAVRDGDIVSAATRAASPLVRAVDLRPGAHVDLVGGFRPDMREADDETIARAIVVADTPVALAEAGDLAQPLASRVLRASDVGLLRDWLRGTRPRRRTDRDRTVYKSVGFAALDLVAAELLLERMGGTRA